MCVFPSLDLAWFRWLGRVGGRSPPPHLPGGHGRGAAAQQRLGHAQHQQPQRQHPQEVLPGRPRL